MDDIIKYCSVDILLEYVRTWDYANKGHGWYLFVPKSKCKTLVQRLFDICLVCKGAIILCSIVIEKSEFTLNLLNQKLTEWCCTEANVINCGLSKLKKFIRPVRYKNENNRPCAHADENWVIARLINELKKLDCQVKFVRFYIQYYGCNEFVENFNTKLTLWLKSDTNEENFCSSTSFKIGSVKIRAHTNDNWLATRLLDQLLKVSESRLSAVHRYIKKYGSDKFVKILNRKLTEWLQSRENLIHCKLNVLYELVRPTSFRIENRIIGASTNDNCLTEILIDQFLKPEVCTIWKEQSYIKKFGNDDFIRYFNKKFTEQLQLHANVKNCKWVVIFELVRPSSYRIKSGEIGATTKDNWLTQRLISELVSPDAKLVLFVIKEFGSKQFVNDFNTNLTIWLQSVENVNKSKWDLLFQTINQTAGTLETGDIKFLQLTVG
ncbi:unnamed protein product [Mytilus edulis]|uniref:Uncharacterized protein n=1 Tax=Mytilus edulis TaxID=6550 RepID=A0A8S3TIQ7_MYTED|nr:unnamed protein product [Mytilus edulis]